MFELKPEQERGAGNLAMGHARRSGREETWQSQPDAAELDEIMVAYEGDSVVERFDPQRHPQPAAEIFFEPRRPGEALGAVDHLRKSPGAGVDPGPALAAAPLLFAHGNERGATGPGGQRERCA